MLKILPKIVHLQNKTEKNSAATINPLGAKVGEMKNVNGGD